MSNRTIRVLCVEDDLETCAIVAVLLGSEGYEVDSAGSVADGLRLAQSNPYDLYILDDWLPDGSGIDLCKRIRESNPTAPILFHSGVTTQAEIDAAIHAGADAYLIKPLGTMELVEAVNRLLHRARAAG